MWGFHISVVRKKFKALSIRSSINSLIAVYMSLKQYNTIQDTEKQKEKEKEKENHTVSTWGPRESNSIYVL